MTVLKPNTTIVGIVSAAQPQITTTTITVLSAAGIIFTFPVATFRSARIAIQASHATAGFEIIEIAMIHNGTDVHYSEYANVFTISTLFDTSINVVSGNVVVTATPVNTNTTFRVIPQTLTVI